MKMAKIEKMLNGEIIIDKLDAFFDKSIFETNADEHGLVFFTPTRVIMYVDKWLSTDYSKQIEINSITNITHEKGLVYTKIRFYTNDGEIKIKTTYHDEAKRFLESLLQQICNENIKFQIDILNPLKLDIENTIKITIDNQNGLPLHNIQIQSDISTLIKCDNPTAKIKTILAKSSEYTAIFITPRISDQIDLGDLYMSYDIGAQTFEKEPIAIGTYEVIETVGIGGGFCTACGEAMPDGAKFCNECGERLQ